ncbi:MAG: hypothetical protein ACRDQA_02840 [Nocardioidaceae bacterium]
MTTPGQHGAQVAELIRLRRQMAAVEALADAWLYDDPNLNGRWYARAVSAALNPDNEGDQT